MAFVCVGLGALHSPAAGPEVSRLAALAPPPTGSVPASVSVSAEAALAALPVKGRAPLTGYARSLFGPAWADVDHNGCDTRDDVLVHYLTQVVLRGCLVESGDFGDPYSGTRVAFQRGPITSMAVEVDHVVALADAWQTGAFAWPASQREQFANDPLDLVPTTEHLNSQKGDSDAASWLPPLKAYRCAYVARQVAVKRRYGLWVTPAERAAIGRVLARCPGRLLPS